MAAAALILVTERTALRPLRRDDTAALHQLWTEPAVRRFLWDDRSIPLAESAAVVERSMALFAARGYGLWGAWTRARCELVGFAGFTVDGDGALPELCYGVAAGAWDRGLASEIAAAVLADAEARCGLRSCLATVDHANAASARVLARLGFEPLPDQQPGGSLRHYTRASTNAAMFAPQP